MPQLEYQQVDTINSSSYTHLKSTTKEFFYDKKTVFHLLFCLSFFSVNASANDAQPNLDDDAPKQAPAKRTQDSVGEEKERIQSLRKERDEEKVKLEEALQRHELSSNTAVGLPIVLLTGASMSAAGEYLKSDEVKAAGGCMMFGAVCGLLTYWALDYFWDDEPTKSFQRLDSIQKQLDAATAEEMGF